MYIEVTGALKMQEWKKKEWKNQEQIAGLKNAGVEKSGAITDGFSNVLQFYKVCILDKCSLYVYRTFTVVLRLYHRRLKLRTDGGYARIARVHELGSIDLFVVTSLKMNQLPPHFEHKFPIMYGILTAIFTARQHSLLCRALY